MFLQILIAAQSVFAWQDHPEKESDYRDVWKVEQSFNQRALKLYTDEGASNARRFPDNENNGNMDNEPEPESWGLIDHYSSRLNRNLIRFCNDNEGSNAPQRADDEKNIDVHDPDPMGLIELMRREKEKNRWFGVPDRD